MTGGSDSLLLVWKDTTEEKKVAALQQRENMLLQEQQLSNLIHADRLLDALALALDLDRPFKVLNIIKGEETRKLWLLIQETKSFIVTNQRITCIKILN